MFPFSCPLRSGTGWTSPDGAQARNEAKGGVNRRPGVGEPCGSFGEVGKKRQLDDGSGMSNWWGRCRAISYHRLSLAEYQVLRHFVGTRLRSSCQRCQVALRSSQMCQRISQHAKCKRIYNLQMIWPIFPCAPRWWEDVITRCTFLGEEFERRAWIEQMSWSWLVNLIYLPVPGWGTTPLYCSKNVKRENAERNRKRNQCKLQKCSHTNLNDGQTISFTLTYDWVAGSILLAGVVWFPEIPWCQEAIWLLLGG